MKKEIAIDYKRKSLERNKETKNERMNELTKKEG